MNNTKIFTSLDNTNELKKLIVENPDLPLLIFVGEEGYCGEYAYNAADAHGICIKEVTIHQDMYIEKSDFEDALFDTLGDEYETDEELAAAVKKIMEEAEIVKAIVVYVG